MATSNGASESTSIVIPCYMQAHFLPEAIESALAQTVGPVEVVVVDDGSPDETSAVAESYSEVTCIRKPNGGVSAARNTGIERSSGDTLIFLDADDRLLPNAVEAGRSSLGTEPRAGYAVGHHRHIDERGEIVMEDKYPILGDDLYEELLSRSWMGLPATSLYRREALQAVGGFDLTFREAADYDLNLRIAQLMPICAHDERVVEYRSHGDAMSNDPAPMFKEAMRALRQQRRYAYSIPRYRAAYKAGLHGWRSYYGDPIVKRLRTQLREDRDAHEIIRAVRALARDYPRGLVKALLPSRYSS